MWILAIETSCDETSVAVMYNLKVKSNIVSSQINNHNKFGGVVPELAARLHLQNINNVLMLALKKANIKINQINYVAYTAKPGLIGALQIGKIVAKTLSEYLEIPLISVNHLHGHVYSGAIENNFIFPLISLLVSGGHTLLIYMKKHLNFQIIGTTLDDAVGECYDKVARMLNFAYPGGPIIDTLAQKGDSQFYNLPIIMNNNTLNFSFSGLKTACFQLIHNLKLKKIKIDKINFCASFQKQCIDQLIRKTKISINKYNPRMLVLSGGVAANYDLRKSIKLLKNKKLKIIIPKLEYCTDNAAMIARVAYQKICLFKNKSNKK